MTSHRNTPAKVDHEKNRRQLQDIEAPISQKELARLNEGNKTPRKYTRHLPLSHRDALERIVDHLFEVFLEVNTLNDAIEGNLQCNKDLFKERQAKNPTDPKVTELAAKIGTLGMLVESMSEILSHTFKLSEVLEGTNDDDFGVRFI